MIVRLVFVLGALFGVLLGMLIAILFDKWSARLAAHFTRKIFKGASDE